MSQHRLSTKTEPTAVTVVRDPLAARGRHRAESRAAERSGIVATVAVAAGALLATSYQVSSPAIADAAPIAGQPDAAPIAGIPGLPALPDLPALPPELTNGINELNQMGQDFAAQFSAHTPVVRPVNGIITSGFGSRWGTMHSGLDFANPIGTPIHSVASGTVIEAGPASGFGLWVRVRQDDGTTAVYGHVNDIQTFVGKRVNAGETIATVGNRGYSTGPHLHLEIWDQNGRKIDPENWLASRGVNVGYRAVDA